VYADNKVTKTRLLVYITTNGKKSAVKFTSTVLKLFKNEAISGNIISYSNGFYVIHNTEQKISTSTYDANSHLINEKEEQLNGMLYPYSNLVHFNKDASKLLFWGHKNSVFESMPTLKQTTSSMLIFYPNYDLFAIKYVGNFTYAFEIGEAPKSAHSILIGTFDAATLKVQPGTKIIRQYMHCRNMGRYQRNNFVAHHFVCAGRKFSDFLCNRASRENSEHHLFVYIQLWRKSVRILH
jgi:hypothetical protein